VGSFTARLQSSFIALALIFGTALGLAMPPMQVNDESTHVFGTYVVSRGNILQRSADGSPGGTVPRRVYRLALGFPKSVFAIPGWKPRPRWTAAQLARADGARPGGMPVEFRAHSAVTYLPHALAIALTNAVGAPTWAQFYAGRLAGLLCWIALVVGAIRIAPILKEAIWLLGLAPMALSSAASFSADTVTTGVAWLFVACVMRIALDERARFSRGWLLVLCGLGATLALAKIAYTPLVAFCLIVPTARFSSRRARWLALLAIVTSTLASLLAWAWAAGAGHLSPPLRYDLPAGSRPWTHLLSDPLVLARAIVVTTWLKLGWYRDSMLGRLGSHDTPMPGWVLALYTYGLAALAVAGGDGRSRVTPGARFVALTIALFCYVAIATVAWLRWSTDPTNIEGVQGRYLLPLAPLGSFAVVAARWRPSDQARRLGHAVAEVLVALALAASTMACSVASGRPKAILSRTVVLAMSTSCGT